MFPRVTLAVVEGAHAGEERTFTDAAVIMIGRAVESTFPLHGRPEDWLVSRRHCVIGVGARGVAVRDLESRNGTFVNGVRLGFPPGEGGNGSAGLRAPLRDGDQIRVGTSLLRVRIEEVSAAERNPDEAKGFSGRGPGTAPRG